MVVIAINPAAMAASLSDIMANLPAILDTLQTVTYIMLILFFGSIAVLGFRIYAPFWKKLLLRLGFGLLSLFSGVAIAGFMPLPDNVFVKLMQLDMLVGGVVASIIFAVSLFILSKAINSEDTLKRAIEKLQKALQKERLRPKQKNAYSNPYFLAGVVIIALFLIFSAANFRGFPSLQEGVLSAFGMTPEDFESMQDVLGNVEGMNLPEGIAEMPNECYNLLGALGRNPDAMSDLSDYDNPQLKMIIEQDVGESVLDIKRATIEGDTAVLAITETGKTCIATENELCVCN